MHNSGDEANVTEEKNHTVLLGKFASFLAEHDHVSQKDIPVTSDNIEEVHSLKLALRSKFVSKDLGHLKYFLGIERATSQKGLLLNQRKYTLDLLKESSLMVCKPVRTCTHLDSKLQLNDHREALLDITEYQRLVSKLIYLTITRPDISYTVSIVSQFMHAPTSVHMQIVKRILHYLKWSISRRLLMQKNDNVAIMGYIDVDWAGNCLDCKSTTSFCTFIGGNLVTWQSKKQNVVA
ncbi:uncharacterized mitochondrial protein AtMg00810-like [Malus sylvestris]|uniref:uncharacterized mitochondrial protein AtMg00810-like n=1 Tax=Malus sylvestris TaxID=3752 RepID=UPI0021AC1B26|nr:uncharacterized mitochondrial protein AtMg00810-like [Malus sylvestris]